MIQITAQCACWSRSSRWTDEKGLILWRGCARKSWRKIRFPDACLCSGAGRRQFVEVAQNFPEECRYVLETLGEVYGYDAQARERDLTPEERLRFHQEHSQPLMDTLHAWLETQFAQRKTDPNSGLGKAIAYLLRHWKGLTLFLREARAHSITCLLYTSRCV